MELVVKCNQNNIGRFEAAERLKSYRGLQPSEFVNITANYTSYPGGVEQLRKQDVVVLVSEFNILNFIKDSIKNNSNVEVTSPSKLLSFKNGILNIITESVDDNIEFNSLRIADIEIINTIIALILAGG